MAATSRKRSTSRRSRSTKSASRRSNSSGMDAISLLKQDHQKVRGLLKRFESNPNENLFEQIENELKVHTQIEEEIFYPAYRDAVEGKEQQEKLYYEALEEHHVVDMVLPEMQSTSEDSPEFEAKGKVLKDLVEHHIKEEERDMFPKARRAMGTAELRDVGMRLQERKQELMGREGRMASFQRMLRPIGGRTSRRRAA